MSRTRFEELVADALDAVPEELAGAMDNVVVLVEDHNEEAPDILGLYHGVALTERTSDYGGVLPTGSPSTARRSCGCATARSRWWRKC